MSSSGSGAEDDEGELTRKQRREQARAQRKALEESEAASAKRRARLTQLGIVAAIVVAVVVVILIATGGGGSSKPVKAGTKVSNENVAVVDSLVGGHPPERQHAGRPERARDAAVLRRPGVPDLQGVHAGGAALDRPEVGAPGKLKIEYHSMETATREPEVFKTQQIAAYAAGKQDLAWYFIELFYHEQGEEDSGYVTESYLQGLAQQVPGLNLTKWTSDRGDPDLANEIESDKQAANNDGFTGTPSFLIGKTGGAMHEARTQLADRTDRVRRSDRKAAEGIARAGPR